MNENSEQLAHDTTACMHSTADWQVQSKQSINLSAALNLTVSASQTTMYTVDYV